MEEFTFEIGVTPLSEWYWVWLTPLLYLTGVKTLKWCAKECFDQRLDLRPLVFLHNLALSIVSCKLFIDMAVELDRMFTVADSDWWSVFCDSKGLWSGGSGTMYYYLYINYILKYIEFGDTALLAIRRKPTEFLHVYHHAITMVLCLVQLRGQTSLQWLIVIMNLFVHVIMYAYYALHALGHQPWWKRYLTELQIAQFIIGATIATIVYIIAQLAKLGVLPDYMKCHGDTFAQTFGLAVIFSYLILFLKFHQKRYVVTNKS